MSEPETIIGIDLGTTNSEVAILDHGRPVIIPNESGNRILPSVVGVDDYGGLLVGEAALNQCLLYPERTVRSIKRRMGTAETVSLGDREYSPQEISAIVLRTLKAQAEDHLRRPIRKAVITVPAYFNDAQRQATREAGEIAGLEVVRILNEPTAAALVYETDLTRPMKVLVYDLGGGTFDVSVVQIEAGVVEVIASHGDNYLGGDDFDREIVELLVERLQEKHGLDVRSDRKVMARLWRAAVAAKLTLSDRPYAAIKEEFLTKKDGVPIHLSLELSRAEYEALISPYIDRTIEALHIALSSAGLTVSEIDDVLLVGGTTRTPLVQERLEDELGRSPQAAIDPDLCVALGAAMQAGMIAGEPVQSVLVDITPYTFGTSYLGELEDGTFYPFVFAPIIKKNTPLPASKAQVFHTMINEQERVDVRVYQGEHQDAQQNTLVGEFMVEGLRKAPAGDPLVVRFDLDLDGILNVTATEKATGLEKSIRIEHAIDRMDQGQISAARSRIGELFGAGAEASEFEEARVLTAKAEGMLAEVGEEDREEIGELLQALREAMERKDSDAVAEPLETLRDILYYLEH
ncbi:Hsp70 family protein [Methylohalobius crimeensis]|uniref:Hsp70 family protein n=1 Tax=Methylohalobius crimeensis TaxID=244365 RepID=UPI0003B43874|nr:Hsp70 family protein [Methylohalobius crimeensis]